MILGLDASTYEEVYAKNPHYYVGKEEVEPLSYVHDHNGVTSLRIRLWLNPYTLEGLPYHGGTNDWDHFVRLAKLAMSKGYDIMLDFHYSDFWCDPSKQTLPKAWASLSLEEVVKKVYDYTKETLLNCQKEHLNITSIQIGNEITNGMLWPLGKLNWVKEGVVREGYDNLVALLKSGVQAAREVMPKAKLIIHLEKSGDYLLHQEFFSEVSKRGLDFDVIGLSYYPYWHGTFPMLYHNIDNLRTLFHKPIWIVETGYGFTMAPFISTENGGANLISDDFFKKNKGNVYKPYPLSIKGQAEFVKTLLKSAPLHGVGAIYYWEPFWLPLPGLEWASKAGEEYIHETNKPTHNEWANQCLFDYEGHATTALKFYKK